MKLLLRFDGACSNNGRPNARASYGWEVLDEAGNVIGHGSGRCGGLQTNNVAEYEGLIAGLEWIQAQPTRPTELRIEGDSRLVLMTLTLRWEVKKKHLRLFRNRVRQLLSVIGCRWSVKWIPRHANQSADALSRRADSIYDDDVEVQAHLDVELDRRLARDD